MARLFFLTPRWIGAGCMLTGALFGGYSFFNVVRYWQHRESGLIPSLWGVTPMAFSTERTRLFQPWEETDVTDERKRSDISR